MSKDDRQIRIDQYLTNQLSSNERREFEEEVSRNAALSEQLADTELAVAAIELAEDQALKSRLQQLDVANFSSDQAGASSAPPASAEAPQAKVVSMPSRRNPRFILGIAAAVLLLLAAGWFLMQPTGFDSPQALAMASYEPYENITNGTVRGGDDDPAIAAFMAYDNGDYASAATAFAALPATAVHKFYLGQSLLATEQFAEAAAQFTDLTKADFGLQQEAGYFLALAQLGAGKTDLAKELLTAIGSEDKHPMQQEARSLLEGINELP